MKNGRVKSRPNVQYRYSILKKKIKRATWKIIKLQQAYKTPSLQTQRGTKRAPVKYTNKTTKQTTGRS